MNRSWTGVVKKPASNTRVTSWQPPRSPSVTEDKTRKYAKNVEVCGSRYVTFHVVVDEEEAARYAQPLRVGAFVMWIQRLSIEGVEAIAP